MTHSVTSARSMSFTGSVSIITDLSNEVFAKNSFKIAEGIRRRRAASAQRSRPTGAATPTIFNFHDNGRRETESSRANFTSCSDRVRIKEEVHEKLRPVTVAAVYDCRSSQCARAERRYVNARVREENPAREKED